MIPELLWISDDLDNKGVLYHHDNAGGAYCIASVIISAVLSHMCNKPQSTWFADDQQSLARAPVDMPFPVVSCVSRCQCCIRGGGSGEPDGI